MYEILIHKITDGLDGYPADLGNELELPASPEVIEKLMSDAHLDQPYIACSYSFRLEEINGLITGPQPLDKLNDFATRLESLSEYERVKLEGAAVLTNSQSIDDCTKLMYNLDSFDLTANVGDYEALGRYYAENDFVDSLKNVPADVMEYFDYDLLGRMGWNDSTNIFINGHHILDTENELHEPDLTCEPCPAYMKMLLRSVTNTNGAWIKFPMVGNGLEYPLQCPELEVVLQSLKVESLEQCCAQKCVSQYPTLEKCLQEHASRPLAEVMWQAQNLGFGIDELDQYGNDAHAKFAAALEYEDCSNLDFAMDISQNLRGYNFAPSIEAYAEEYLTQKGVDPMFAPCFDLITLGDMLSVRGDAVTTESGIISRNDRDFIFDYYQQTHEQIPQAIMQEMEIKLYCPLEVKTDPNSTLGENYGDVYGQNDYAIIPNSVAGYYVDEINAALHKELQECEQEHGLAKYIHNLDLQEKVNYIWPLVEVHEGELWGVVDIKLNQDLSPTEMTELIDYCVGQMSDGLGESVEQHPIKTDDGDLYVSLWHSGDDYFMKPEEEFKLDNPEQEQGVQMDM